jgi:Domain of unknown function (DUF3600)
MENQFKQEVAKIEIPAELHKRSKLGIHKAKAEMGGRVTRFVKKRVAIAAISACLLIPTGAFAYQALLADDLYGSFDHLKRHVASATMESYLLVDAKLNQAKGELGQEQYDQFKELLNVFIDAKLEYGDKNGNVEYSQVPAAQLEEIKAAMYDIQPYFDTLNGLPSSKKVLTAEEYEQYIQALMTYESTMAQIGISTPPEIDRIPADLQKPFTEAQEYLIFVNEKQINN